VVLFLFLTIFALSLSKVSSKRNIFIQHSVNQDTGEVTDKMWVTKQSMKYAKFIKYYAEGSEYIEQLTHAQYRVFFELSQLTEYNTNLVSLDKPKKDLIATRCNIKYINQIISVLVKMNLLIKISSVSYMINPRVLFNGEESERFKILQDKGIF